MISFRVSSKLIAGFGAYWQNYSEEHCAHAFLGGGASIRKKNDVGHPALPDNAQDIESKVAAFPSTFVLYSRAASVRDCTAGAGT